MSTIQPVILTADTDVLLGFCTKVFGAEEIFRVLEEGPAFHRGLRIGDTDLGLGPGRPRGPGRRHRGCCSASVSTTPTRRSAA